MLALKYVDISTKFERVLHHTQQTYIDILLVCLKNAKPKTFVEKTRSNIAFNLSFLVSRIKYLWPLASLRHK